MELIYGFMYPTQIFEIKDLTLLYYNHTLMLNVNANQLNLANYNYFLLFHNLVLSYRSIYFDFNIQYLFRN